tara:strand:- start:319 stop:1083 length:765 start_codon:yes stop_codon:yes gene_type:complete
MRLQDTLFPVKEDIIYKRDGEASGYKFIMRKDTDEILSCVTDKYKMVTNKDVIGTAEPVLKEIGAKLTECETFTNGARASWTWKIPDVKVKVDKGDEVNPQITIKNSYDGSVGLHILAGAFRLVCSNGLVIGNTISNKVNKHSIYNIDLDNVEESVKNTVNTVESVFKKDFPVLINTDIQQKHIQNLIKMFPDFTMESLTQYLIAHKPHTFWDLLNAATWVATHTMKRNYETTHKLETRIYPSITKWATQAAKS